MSLEISKKECEICGEPSLIAMNDKDGKLHFGCEKHIKELWTKIGRP